MTAALRAARLANWDLTAHGVIRISEDVELDLGEATPAALKFDFV